MQRLILGLCALLLAAAPVRAEGLRFIPPVGRTGEAVRLQWDGPVPALAVARVGDQRIHLRPEGQGAWGLIGIDIGQKPEPLPVQLALTGQDGNSRFVEATLIVEAKDRPTEHLTLPEQMVTPKGARVLARIHKEQKRLLSLFAADTHRGTWQRLQRPVDDPVSSIFGVQRVLNGKPRSPHGGTDFRSPAGTTVHASADGRVVLAEDLYYTGRTVVLDHGDGLYSLYAHLSEIQCRSRQSLAGGEVLGAVGSTGRSTGPHLHWSMRLRGTRIDPMQLLDLVADLP